MAAGKTAARVRPHELCAHPSASSRWVGAVAGRAGHPGGRGQSPGAAPRGAGGGGEVEPGTYLVTLDVGGKKQMKPLQVLQDRWLNER